MPWRDVGALGSEVALGVPMLIEKHRPAQHNTATQTPMTISTGRRITASAQRCQKPRCPPLAAPAGGEPAQQRHTQRIDAMDREMLSSAGSKVSAANTAAATTHCAPQANRGHERDADQKRPAKPIMTVRPLKRIASPAVETVQAMASCTERPAPVPRGSGGS